MGYGRLAQFCQRNPPDRDQSRRKGLKVCFPSNDLVLGCDSLFRGSNMVSAEPFEEIRFLSNTVILRCNFPRDLHWGTQPDVTLWGPSFWTAQAVDGKLRWERLENYRKKRIEQFQEHSAGKTIPRGTHQNRPHQKKGLVVGHVKTAPTSWLSFW